MLLVLCGACAGEAPALRRDVAELKSQLGRLEQTNAMQGEQIRALAEKVASLQASPMVVLAPPATPRARPLAAATAAVPAADPLVPPGLEVVKLEPEPDAAPRLAPRPRARGRAPPAVPTSVPLVVPEGALP